MIIKELNLKRPIYKKTASGGHFGRDDPDFTWEKPKDLSYAMKKWWYKLTIFLMIKFFYFIH